ncbi:MAG TPA: amidohydrolase, partial [Thermodesulfobacteriota bacterium]|nr:amidohydrolase [Thermodesulfobacteriota bacterium]
MLDEIKNKVCSIKERMVDFRRKLHRNPELSGQEEKTAAFVEGVLKDNGVLDVRKGVGGWGVTGVVRGGNDGPAIALRADMDALPIGEKTGKEYSSAVPGVMHACGHDVHTAVLLGTAITLAGLRERLSGNVKFIFQPSEETGNGG